MIRSLIGKNLGKLAGDEDDPQPGSRELGNDPMDLHLCANVTPRVGSSRMSTRGFVASHFAMTTFC